MTQNQRRAVAAILQNDEASSDAELLNHFMEELGLSRSDAETAIAKRGQSIKGDIVEGNVALIDLLWDFMKRDPEHNDRVRTGWGTKTKVGLCASIQRIITESTPKTGPDGSVLSNARDEAKRSLSEMLSEDDYPAERNETVREWLGRTRG